MIYYEKAFDKYQFDHVAVYKQWFLSGDLKPF
jgi:hypothetical protein